MTTETPKHYKILELRVEGIKRISVVNIRPDGNLVQITGPNGQGKSSILDAVEWLFAGKRAIQEKPIRDGEETALIKADLGDMKVTRKFKRVDGGDYTTSVKIEYAGGKVSTEQGLLTALIGDFSFDPIAFGRMKAEEQFTAARKLVPGVDFDALARADKVDYDARTDANRLAKDRRTQANAIALPAGAIPAAVDVAALEAKLAEAATHNADVERRQFARDQARARIMDIEEQIKALEAERAGLLGKLETAAALPDRIDVADVQAKLAAGRETNAVRADADRRDAYEAQAKAAEEESARLTAAMDAREAEKQAAIAAAKMPVPGLSFAAGAVLLNGQPFAQASTAQQWVAGVGIAAALNPRLRVIHIKDGSLIGNDNMAVLAALAEQMDLQIWVERLESYNGVGFELVDGHLKGEAPPAPAPADDDVI